MLKDKVLKTKCFPFFLLVSSWYDELNDIVNVDIIYHYLVEFSLHNLFCYGTRSVNIVFCLVLSVLMKLHPSFTLNAFNHKGSIDTTGHDPLLNGNSSLTFTQLFFYFVMYKYKCYNLRILSER